MRRRSDDWINATHILKIAGFDKPARTRILEREVQKGVHEKIQGGYGKYQGTWIPLSEGRTLAEKNGIFHKLQAILDFVPGDRSPPPAPKHSTAASNRNKGQMRQLQTPQPHRQQVTRQPHSAYQEVSEIYPDPTQSQQYYEADQGHATPDNQSFLDEGDFALSQNSTAMSKKRKRDEVDMIHAAIEQEHVHYGDALLDYFVTSSNDQGYIVEPPRPPENYDVNRPIDNHGHTALHWACAMGDVPVTRDLLSRGANPNKPAGDAQQTPLMRAVLFTNNYDKQSFGKIVSLLAGSIVERDHFGATVFHHIAHTLASRGKWNCARYYCEILINKMQEMGTNYVQTLLRSVDSAGDTAVLIAVRHGCMKVAHFLINHCPEAADQINHEGETANELLRALKERRETLEQLPSSPPSNAGPLSNLGKMRRRNLPKNASRAASIVMSRVESASQEVSTKIAGMYETEMKEKDAAISESKQSLKDFEDQRHRVKTEVLQLTAQVQHDEERQLENLRYEYETLLAETQSLLEQKDHARLQTDVRQRDQQTNPHSFRSANPARLTPEEISTALPWAIELHNQQQSRRQLIREIAALTAAAGTGERIGKHRKLVAIATGIREDELDEMSDELLQSLQATAESTGPQTPPMVA